jgi:hypothetical protein
LTKYFILRIKFILILDNILKPLGQDIKNYSMSFLYQQIANAITGGKPLFGKRELNSLPFGDELYQILINYQQKLIQLIQNCLSNPELIRNLKEEIKTASKELVKQVMEFVLKHFSNSETRNKEIFNNVNNIINNFILNFN